MTINEEKGQDLEKLTRVILIIGIIGVSIGIVAFATRPTEEFDIFILLNEDKVMGNYPLNATQNEDVFLHIFLESHYLDTTDFMVMIYRGNNDTQINSTIGVNNAEYIDNLTITLNNNQNWTSDIINISFPNIGKNQTVLFELYKKEGGEWKYIPNQVLFIRLEILEH